MFKTQLFSNYVLSFVDDLVRFYQFIKFLVKKKELLEYQLEFIENIIQCLSSRAKNLKEEEEKEYSRRNSIETRPVFATPLKVIFEKHLQIRGELLSEMDGYEYLSTTEKNRITNKVLFLLATSSFTLRTQNLSLTLTQTRTIPGTISGKDLVANIWFDEEKQIFEVFYANTKCKT